MLKQTGLLYWFSEVDKEDIPIVGGKGANLGEMYHAGFPVPNGFIVSSKSYFQFIRDNNFTTKIKHLLSTTNFDHPDSLMQVSHLIKKVIMQGEISDDLVEQIFQAYRRLGGSMKNALVAVRSSATAEDLPTASFAGQQETYLNVHGEAVLMHKIKEAWASLFEPRAIFYRHEQHFDHFRVGIAIVVQLMVESERSGVMFTIDPVTNDKSKIVIEGIYGLGEMIVQGMVTPDHYEVDKKEHKIINKVIASQDKQLVKAGIANKEVKINGLAAKKQKITDTQILAIADLGRKLEKHYYFPQDVEWSIVKGKVYIVQTRAITTTHEAKRHDNAVTTNLPIIATGAPASPGIASGPTKIVRTIHDTEKIVQGDVMVAPQTNPDFVPAMKKASAIVTERGGRTSHAAIVSRELGIPAVVGVDNATKLVPLGNVVTVDGAKGIIYKGSAVSSSVHADRPIHQEFIKTATKVYVNLAQPELAEKVSKQHVDGVGLLRAEFMMASIGVHPKKLIHDGKKQLFINELAEKLEMFCKAFNPRPVVYRASDFKTNEYRGLTGGKDYEPIEPNPMLGYRGAYRYMHDPQVFDLELEAIKIIRNKKNLKNLWLEIPFVRTVRELTEVKKIVSAAGLYRSSSFQLWMMVEIPSNVILLDQFLEVGIDGISIGSNDLTMLILGTDRDNSEVASEYDEQNPAVLWALEKIIKTAQKHHVTSSICGQAPSLYPALCEKLVEWGITSISVSPDVIESVRKNVSTFEKQLAKR